MLRISKKAEYALIAILYIDQSGNSEPVTCREITDHFDIPYELTGKVLQKLKKSGYIQSTQGVKGGYQLAKSLNDISLQSFLDCIEGSTALVRCTGQCSCEREEQCNIKTPMHHLQYLFHHFTENISLAQFSNADLSPEAIGAYNVYFERV